MSKKKVTSLEEIRDQLEPEVIEIPGFKAGVTINVAVRPVDLTPHLLTLGIGNPLLDVAIKKAREGKSLSEIENEIEESSPQRGIETMLPIVDAVCKEALVEPTWDEIFSVHPLTLTQKIVIFNKATGDITGLRLFRSE